MLVVSLFLALAIEPAVNHLVRRGWKRGLATGFAILVVALIGIVFITSVGLLIVRQVGNLIDRTPDYLEQLVSWINRTFKTELNVDDLRNELTREGGPARELAQRLAGSTLDISLTAVGLLLQMFSVGLFTFYLVADGPRFRRTVCSVLRPDLQREVLRGWDLAIDKTGGYLYSRGVLALLSAFFHWIAFRIIGIDNPEVLALWVGVISQFVPVVGTYLAGMLAGAGGAGRLSLQGALGAGVRRRVPADRELRVRATHLRPHDAPPPGDRVRRGDRRRRVARADRRHPGTTRRRHRAGLRVVVRPAPRGGRLPPAPHRATPAQTASPAPVA